MQVNVPEPDEETWFAFSDSEKNAAHCMSFIISYLFTRREVLDTKNLYVRLCAI